RASSKDVSARASSRDVNKVPAPRASRSAKEGLVREAPEPRASRPARVERPERAERAPRQEPEGGWVSFRVTWGKEHGADARRILAMVCRRGDVDGNQVGAIRIDRHHSIVDVARPVAKSFAEATMPPDPRNPRVRISEERGGSSGGARDSREHRSSAHTGNHPPRRAR
ncbi:MAG: DbpA RNA binding domain-containing protein, partial [Polyangiaceae bacterium]